MQKTHAVAVMAAVDTPMTAVSGREDEQMSHVFLPCMHLLLLLVLEQERKSLCSDDRVVEGKCKVQGYTTAPVQGMAPGAAAGCVHCSQDSRHHIINEGEVPCQLLGVLRLHLTTSASARGI